MSKKKEPVELTLEQILKVKQLGPVMMVKYLLSTIDPKVGGVILPEDYDRVKLIVDMWNMRLQDKIKEIDPEFNHVTF